MYSLISSPHLLYLEPELILLVYLWWLTLLHRTWIILSNMTSPIFSQYPQHYSLSLSPKLQLSNSFPWASFLPWYTSKHMIKYLTIYLPQPVTWGQYQPHLTQPTCTLCLLVHFKLSWTCQFDIMMSNLCWRLKCCGVCCCITVLSAPSVLKEQSFKTSGAPYTDRQCHIPENPQLIVLLIWFLRAH